jgi:glycosyltransferase involved in cell wall biosynthesis
MNLQKVVIDIIIPAFNEENAIALVLNDIPKSLVRQVVVVNNNSNDKTVLNAQNAGAIVLHETYQGYGAACLNGINYVLAQRNPPDIIVFLDADYSDFPQEMCKLIEPIVYENYDFVIGIRVKSARQHGSMQPQQIFGNWLATFLIRIFFRYKYYDLGPFRAIKAKKLAELNMQDKTYGWTVEMQVKALKKQLKIKQVPVSYRCRKGKSKISGTLKGTVLAGYKIITTIFKNL